MRNPQSAPSSGPGYGQRPMGQRPMGQGGPPRSGPGGPPRSGPGGPPRSGPGGGPRGGPRRGGRGRYYTRRKVCGFCANHVAHVDYKDVDMLIRYVSDQTRIESRRKSGVCSKHQRELARAIKRARHLAMLPSSRTHLEGPHGRHVPQQKAPLAHPAADVVRALRPHSRQRGKRGA